MTHAKALRPGLACGKCSESGPVVIDDYHIFQNLPPFYDLSAWCNVMYVHDMTLGNSGKLERLEKLATKFKNSDFLKESVESLHHTFKNWKLF